MRESLYLGLYERGPAHAAVAGFEHRIRCDPDEMKLNMQEKVM